MCRSLIICLALVFGLVSTSFADVLIGNFEDGMSDNWVAGPEGGELWSSIPLNHGVTLDEMALCVTTTGGYWTLTCNLPVMDLSDATAVKLNLTMLAVEWDMPQWTNIEKLGINSDGPSEWQEYLPTAIDRTTGLPTSLDWFPLLGNAYKTITWDLTSYSYNSTGATYMQFNIAMQNPYAGTGAFHIDNVWIIDEYLEGDTTGSGYEMTFDCPGCVPEPTTIALLGLGGLALLRRKR